MPIQAECSEVVRMDLGQTTSADFVDEMLAILTANCGSGTTISSDYDGTLVNLWPFECGARRGPICAYLKACQDEGKIICEGSSRPGGFPTNPCSDWGVTFTPAGQGECPDSRGLAPGVNEKLQRMCATSHPDQGEDVLIDNRCTGQVRDCGNGTSIKCVSHTNV